MLKYTSGRQKNLKIGISSHSENSTSLQVVGNVGIGTTDAGGRSLYVIGNAEITGITTLNGVVVSPGIVTAAVGFGTIVYYGDGSKLLGIGSAAQAQSVALSTNTTSTATSIVFSSTPTANPTATLNSNPNLIFDAANTLLGIGSTSPTATLDIGGNVKVSGIITTSSINATAGIITNLTGVAATITTLNATAGIITNLTGVAATITTLNATAGIVTNLTGVAATITSLNVTSGIITNLTGVAATIITLNVAAGIITNLTGVAATITSLNVTAGIVTNLTGVAATITNLDVTSGIVTSLTGVAATITSLNVTAGIITNLTGVAATITNLNVTSGIITNLTGVAGTITTLSGTTATYATLNGTDANINSGIITTLSGTTATYTTLNGTDANINTGIITGLTGTNLNYSGIATLGTLQVSGDTSTLNLNVSGVTTLGIVTSGSIFSTGIITATQLSTGSNGIGINTDTISGPAVIYIDPTPVGVGTTSGIVRIRGDLYVDGTQFVVNSSTVELADLRVGIATTVGTNLLLDGGGIGIGSANILKTFTYNNASDSLKSSENLDLASGKTYKINGTDVLSSTTLGNGVVDSLLTSVGTLGQLNVSGVSTFGGITTVTGSTLFSKQLDVSGVATVGSLVVNNSIVAFGASFTSLNVSGVTTLGVTSATDLTSQQLNVSGTSTLGVTTTTSLTSQQLNVSGVSTLSTVTSTNSSSQQLNVSGVTTLGVTSTTDLTSQQLNVSGVTTVGFITASNLYVSGVVTATAYYGSGSNLTGLIPNTISTSSTSTPQYIGFLTTNNGITTSIFASPVLTYIPSSGNLGIGITSPTTKLTISGSTGISFADSNIRIGDSLTGSSITSGVNNFFAGSGSGQSNDVGDENIFLGLQAGRFNTTGTQNIFFGTQSGFSNSDGYNNIFLGPYAGRQNTLGSNNNFFGKGAGRYNTTGTFNNFFGNSAGFSNATGSYNVFLGSYAGQNQTSGDQNVILGYNQSTPDLVGSNQLVIGAGNTAWIYGNRNYNVGIGTTNPTSKLHIIGDVLVSGVVTATSFSGILIGYATNAGVATYAINAGISTYANISGIATYATIAGIATYADISGIATYAINAGISTYTDVAGIATYADVAGIATYADIAGIATYADIAGIATYAINAGVTTYADIAGIATYAINAGVATDVIGGIGSITQLDVSGITTTAILNVGTGGTIITTTSDGLVGIGTAIPTSTLSVQGDGIFTGVVTATSLYLSGIVTSSNPGITTIVYYGDGSKLTGIGTAASSQSVNISADTTTTNTSIIFSNTPNASPASLLNSNPTLIFNAANSSLGIGTTNPTSTLSVQGDGVFTGVVTASSFRTSGSIVGTSLSISEVSTLGTVQISSGIVTATSGIVTYYGDGSKLINVSLSYANNAGVATYATVAGVATYATYAEVAGVSTYATVAGVATYANVAGIATYADVAGISTYANVAGIATYADVAGIATSVIGGIGSITQLRVTGISTFTNGPVFVGSGTSTGTASQLLQVTGGAYVSGNLGIGTINPQTKLEINGVLGFSPLNNVRIGDNSTGANITSGTDNIFMGLGAGNATNTGTFNNFIGFLAGFYNTAGTDNNFVGSFAGHYNLTGSYNNFFGRYAGYQNQDGNYNNFLGYSAGRNTTGNNNNFFGSYAGQSNSTGNYNNFFGLNAGTTNTTGNRNIFLGNFTGRSTAASYKVVVGTGLNGSRLFDAPNITKDKQFAVGLNTTGTTEYWLVGNEDLNIGIGTTNPTSKLHVIGDVLVSGVVTATTFYGDGSQLSGIGSAASVVLSPNTTSTSTSIVFSQFSSANPASQLNSNPSLVFNALNTRLGIGSTVPTATLDIGGDIKVLGVSTLGSVEISSGIITASSGIVTYYGDGSQLINIQATSIVGFATYASASGVSTDVIGGIASVTALTVSGVSTFNQISAGGTTGSNQYVLSSTGTGLSWQPVTSVGGGTLDGIIVQDEGSIVGTAGSITTLNFVGNNISVSAVPLGIAATITVSDTPNFNSLSINGTVDYGSATATTTSVSQVGIHSTLSTSTYRSVEYTIQATQGTNFHATKILALHNGTIAYNSEYGTIYNNTSVGAFDVDISGGNIRLLVTPASSSSTTYTINFIATKI